MLFRYPGGKGKLSHFIVGCILDFYRSNDGNYEYREPFFGAGAIGWELVESIDCRNFWINDIDRAIAAIWTCIINDPQSIIDQVAAGSEEKGKELNVDLFKILDRKEAIEKALSLANAEDLVLVTGKGSEQAMAVADGKHVPWDDREVIKDWLKSQ